MSERTPEQIAADIAGMAPLSDIYATRRLEAEILAALTEARQEIATLRDEAALYDNAQCITCKKHLDLSGEADAQNMSENALSDYDRFKAEHPKLLAAEEALLAAEEKIVQQAEQIAALREALVKVRAHTSYIAPTVELLRGLLSSIERITDFALFI